MSWSLPVPLGSCQAFELDGHIVVMGPPSTLKAATKSIVVKDDDKDDDDNHDGSESKAAPATASDIPGPISLSSATSSTSSSSSSSATSPRVRHGGGRPIWLIDPRAAVPTWMSLPSLDDDAIGYAFTVA